MLRFHKQPDEYYSENQADSFRSIHPHFYLIDIELHDRFYFRKFNNFQNQNKENYLILRQAVVYTLSPLLESFLQTGLVSTTKGAKNTLITHPWDLIVKYYKKMGGNRLLSDSLLCLLDTYGPNIVESGERFGEHDHMLYVVHKIMNIKEKAKSEALSMFILEGILRGDLAAWFNFLCVEWQDLSSHYEPSSFVRCSNIEDLVNRLLKLKKVKLDIDFYF